MMLLENYLQSKKHNTYSKSNDKPHEKFIFSSHSGFFIGGHYIYDF